MYGRGARTSAAAARSGRPDRPSRYAGTSDPASAGDRPRNLHDRLERRRGFVAVGAGLASGSIALVSFGVDSAIEVTSAVGSFWRLRKAGPDADALEESDGERKALYIVAATFFALATYIIYESVSSLVTNEEPESSTVGLVLVLSLAIMPTLAWWKQRTGKEMGSRALQADAIETWVCSYLSLALLLGVDSTPPLAGRGPTRSPR